MCVGWAIGWQDACGGTMNVLYLLKRLLSIVCDMSAAHNQPRLVVVVVVVLQRSYTTANGVWVRPRSFLDETGDRYGIYVENNANAATFPVHE